MGNIDGGNAGGKEEDRGGNREDEDGKGEERGVETVVI